MAKRKDTGAQVTQTVVEERPGETHVHRTVREWHPHAPERLAEIEAIIDSWGRRPTDAPRRLGDEELLQRVDRVTKRVKDSRKVVVKETVTEWVDRPVAESEPTPTGLAVEETVARHDTQRTRPKRRFQILGFIGRKPEKAAKPKKDKAKGKAKPSDGSDPEYQPQCAALTEDGQQCRNSARGVSRYCSSHKGYQPPTAKGLAKRIEGEAWDPRDDVTDTQSVKGADTRPVVRKAKDTRIKVRKAVKKGKTGKRGGRRTK